MIICGEEDSLNISLKAVAMEIEVSVGHCQLSHSVEKTFLFSWAGLTEKIGFEKCGLIYNCKL